MIGPVWGDSCRLAKCYITDVLTSGGRKAAASLIDELAEFRGEKGLNILRALTRGEIDAADALSMISAAYSAGHHA